MADKKFCGSGAAFGQYGSIKVGLRADQLPAPNERGYINVIVSPKRDKPGEYYVAVDDFVPTKRGEAASAPQKDDPPF